MQHHITHNQPVVSNKFAKTSLVLSLVAIGFLVLAVPCIIIGFFLISMAGQSPMASGVDMDDSAALEEYSRESGRLGLTGVMFINIPPLVSGISGVTALIFGIIGVRAHHKRGQAIAGILVSIVPIFAGVLMLLFGGLLDML